MASFLASFETDLASGRNLLYLCGQIWPVLKRLASFETDLATDLATTFRWNCNVLPLIWPIGQFCSSCQRMSKFTIYIASIRNKVGFCPRGGCTCGSSLLVAGVGVLARLPVVGTPFLKTLGSGISACTIDRVANIDHNEGDGTSIFWTLFFAIAPMADHNYATQQVHSITTLLTSTDLAP